MNIKKILIFISIFGIILSPINFLISVSIGGGSAGRNPQPLRESFTFLLVFWIEILIAIFLLRPKTNENSRTISRIIGMTIIILLSIGSALSIMIGKAILCIDSCSSLFSEYVFAYNFLIVIYIIEPIVVMTLLYRLIAKEKQSANNLEELKPQENVKISI